MANHNENLKSLLESIFINNNLGDANYTEICNQLTVLINNIIKVTHEHINHVDTALTQHIVQNNEETNIQLDDSLETQDILVNDLHVHELEYNSDKQEIPNKLMDSVNSENDNNQLDDLLESQENYHAKLLGAPEIHNEAEIQENIEPDLKHKIDTVLNEEKECEYFSQSIIKDKLSTELVTKDKKLNNLEPVIEDNKLNNIPPYGECDVLPKAEPVTDCDVLPEIVTEDTNLNIALLEALAECDVLPETVPDTVCNFIPKLINEGNNLENALLEPHTECDVIPYIEPIVEKTNINHIYNQQLDTATDNTEENTLSCCEKFCGLFGRKTK